MFWNDIYFCPKFFEFSNTLIENKFPSLEGDHPRMIIPFRNQDGEMFAYQGRAFGKEKQKYITIVLDKDHPKIFGYDRVDTSVVFMSWKALLIVFLLRTVWRLPRVIYDFLSTKTKRFLFQTTNQETDKSVNK